MATSREVISISKDALRDLKCSICGYFLTVPPIYVTSHDADQYKCGRCLFVNTEMSVPARVFETLASNLRFPCSHSNCKKILLWNDIWSHEQICMYRPMKCRCGESFEIREAHEHFLKNHPNMVSMDHVIIKNLEFSWIYMRCIIKNKEPFLVHIRCEKKADIKVGVYRLTSTSKEYEFKLEISNNSNTSKIIITNKKVDPFKVREHCLDCLLGKCEIRYHKYQNSTNDSMLRITNTSSVLMVLNSDGFNLMITVTERSTHPDEEDKHKAGSQLLGI